MNYLQKHLGSEKFVSSRAGWVKQREAHRPF